MGLQPRTAPAWRDCPGLLSHRPAGTSVWIAPLAGLPQSLCWPLPQRRTKRKRTRAGPKQ
jgi:hypothetical protein